MVPRFPAGTTLKKGVRTLAIDDRDALVVPLNEKASGIGQGQCTRMAAQLLFTVRGATSLRLEQVELQRSRRLTAVCAQCGPGRGLPT